MQKKDLSRRNMLKLAALGAFVAASPRFLRAYPAFAANGIDKITKSDDEWRQILSPEQYDILRKEGTERPFTSPLLNEHRAGVFACAGCGLELFTSDKKFDSGTGWPSFFQAIGGRVETKSDTSLLMERTEYHCARCGGHHGHLFADGPEPTGLRYCSNGAVLTFTPKGA